MGLPSGSSSDDEDDLVGRLLKRNPSGPASEPPAPPLNVSSQAVQLANAPLPSAPPAGDLPPLLPACPVDAPTLACIVFVLSIGRVGSIFESETVTLRDCIPGCPLGNRTKPPFPPPLFPDYMSSSLLPSLMMMVTMGTQNTSVQRTLVQLATSMILLIPCIMLKPNQKSGCRRIYDHSGGCDSQNIKATATHPQELSHDEHCCSCDCQL